MEKADKADKGKIDDGKAGKTAEITPEEKARRAKTPCNRGPKCWRLDKKLHPNGCDFYHPKEHYDNYVPRDKGAAGAEGGKGGKAAGKAKAAAKSGAGRRSGQQGLASGARAPHEEDHALFESGSERPTEAISAFGAALNDRAMQDAGFTDFAPAVGVLRRAHPKESLEEKFAALSSVLGLDMQERSLDEFDDSQFTHLEKPRHPGYNTSTRVVFSRLAMPILLDSGSTTCALMEEAVMTIAAEAIRAFDAGELTKESDIYPIVRLLSLIHI